MQTTASIARTQHEATVSPWIFWIVLDNLTRCHDVLDFLGSNHWIAACHLSNGVG